MTVSWLPDHTVLHFPLNCLDGAAPDKIDLGFNQHGNSLVPSANCFPQPPTSLAVSLITEDRLDRLQGQSFPWLLVLPTFGSSVSWHEWGLNLGSFPAKGKTSFSTASSDISRQQQFQVHQITAKIPPPIPNCILVSPALVQGCTPGHGPAAGVGAAPAWMQAATSTVLPLP